MMDPKVLIAKRVAQELKDGDLVNLGIGIPTLVADYIPQNVKVLFQSENGIIGMGPIPEEGLEHPDLTNAGASYVSAIQGAV
jgi:acetate CoA/acetoacetate CoA-transferase beta subunit